MQKLSFQSANEIRHAYILASPSDEAAFETAKCIAGAAVCLGNPPLPCGCCAACRKTKAGSHPDIQVITRLEDDKGKKKRELTVDQVRMVSSDAAILPNEAPRKVYIFREAETMNTEAQNAALKLLEEPPNGAVLLLCTSNPARLLTTVRSRCVEINIPAADSEENAQLCELAEKYLQTLSSGNRFALWKYCEENNSLSIQEMTDFCLLVIRLITDILCLRRKNPGISDQILLLQEKQMETCIRYLSVNVSVKQLFGILAASPMPKKASK